jgi:hypothetical protein
LSFYRPWEWLLFLFTKTWINSFRPLLTIRLKRQIVEPDESEKQEETATDEKSNLIDAPDPFAPPVNN